MISLERRDGRPLRIGHRGAPALAPENTLRSFRAAARAGVHLVEFDVLDLRGGELVVAHSDDLLEVSHGAARGTVRDKSLSELRRACPELATLEEALAFFVDEAPELGAHVDLKSSTAADGLAAAVRRAGLEARCLVTSLNAAALRRFSALAPEVRTGISFPEDRLGLHGRRGSGPVIGGGLRVLRALAPRLVVRLLARSGASAVVLHHALVRPAAVRVAHGRGAAVVAWTVTNERDLARVDAAGADAVVADDPAIFVSTLQA